jgi:hypothetical protein
MPELIVIIPLTLVGAVKILIDPLVLVIPSPDNIFILPPAESTLSPPIKEIDPPVPVTPDPTLSIIDPLEPDAKDLPVKNDNPPEFPLELVPDIKDSEPLIPELPSLLAILTFPDEVTPPIDIIHKD